MTPRTKVGRQRGSAGVTVMEDLGALPGETEENVNSPRKGRLVD